MPTYSFFSRRRITCCSRCPLLSYDSKACGLGMGGLHHFETYGPGMDGPHHWEATHMLDHPEWLFDHRPAWCMLSWTGSLEAPRESEWWES